MENLSSMGIADKDDFAVLTDDAEYIRYFALLQKVMDLLDQVFSVSEDEDVIVRGYIERLMYTLKLLSIKYLYSDEHERPLWVDVSDSGFPNRIEFDALNIDVEMRSRKLQMYPPRALLNQRLVDSLIKDQNDPDEILDQLGLVTYLELLDPTKLLLPYVGGDVQMVSEDQSMRTYRYDWACFDMATNLMHVHWMIFEQDRSRPIIGPGTDDYVELMEKMKVHGARVPTMAVLAGGIDQAVSWLKPKQVHRVCIGPLYSTMLMDEPEDESLRLMLEACDEFCGEDPIIFITEEMIISDREKRGGLFGMFQEDRQIFRINKEDALCLRRQATTVRERMILPHLLRQQIPVMLVAHFPAMGRSTCITYDERGKIHGV